MYDKVRKLAVLALKSVSEGGFSNIVLDRELEKSGFEKRDRSFASAIFYGTLERRITIDYLISRYSSKPINDIDPTALEILRCGIYQILYLNSVPDSAAVNESVNLCKAMAGKGTDKFVNAILRSFLREGKQKPFENLKGFEKVSIMYSVPIWLCKMWCKEYGSEKAVKAFSASLGRPETYIRTNTTKILSDSLLEILEKNENGAKICDFPAECIFTPAQNVTEMEPFKNGLFHVQDKSSQIAVFTLSPKPGDRILDVCAAPGGKSFTAAEMMENKGEIIACDIHKKRCNLIEDGAKRLGLTAIKTLVNDGTVYNDNLGNFDKVLCDVPCSGLGVIRRKPEIRFKSYSEVKSLPAVQFKIASVSSGYLKSGGIMVYSTCTLSHEENDNVVQRLIKECALHPVSLPKELLKYSEDGFSVSFMPGQIGSDGFYFALLGKD